MSNFGIGLAGLATGLNQGLDLGLKIKGIMKQNELEGARQDGIAAAKDARSADVAKLVQSGIGGAANADNTMTVPTFNVDGKSYGDEASATDAASKSKQIGSMEEYFQKVASPKIYERYLEIDPEQAAAWKDWSDKQDVKTGMKHWANAVQSAGRGDFEGFGQNLVKAYNTHGYSQDGMEVKDWKTLKDKNGDIVGAQLTFKGPDGKETSQVFNGMEDVYRMGSTFLAPDKQFELGWSEIQQARKAQVANAQLGIRQQNALQMEGIRQQGRQQLEGSRQQAQQQLQTQRDNAAMDRTQTQAQLKDAQANRTANAKVAALKAAGYDDAFIKQNMPAILGIGEFKKPAAPEEVRRMLHQARLSDFQYQRKSPAEQAAVIDQDMKLIQGGAQQQRNPLSSGITPPAGRPAGNAPMILDTKTGQMVPYQR